MKNSEILMLHMRAYAADYDKADEARKKAIRNISHWKEDCIEYSVAYQNIQKQFRETMTPSYNEHLNCCIEVLTDATKKLKGTCSGDVKNSFNSDIALIQAAQANLTDMEYSFYLEKYSDSFQCANCILSLARANGKLESVHMKLPGTIKKYIEECVMIVSNFFNGYGETVGNYMAMMSINKDEETGLERNRICKVFNDYVDPFLNGNFFSSGVEVIHNNVDNPKVLEEGSVYNLSTRQIFSKYEAAKAYIN